MTFYYAIGGDELPQSVHCVSYDNSECDWNSPQLYNPCTIGETFFFGASFHRLVSNDTGTSGIHLPPEIALVQSLSEISLYKVSNEPGSFSEVMCEDLLPIQALTTPPRLQAIHISGSPIGGTVPTNIGLLTLLKDYENIFKAVQRRQASTLYKL